MRDAFIGELSRLAAEDPSVILVTGDLGFGVLTEFAETFSDQYVNAGVAEQNMTAVACGLALEGRKVYTYSIANFTTLRCLEQIRNDVCYHSADVTMVSVGGGFSYGQLGVSHFATEDLAILRALPNMAVVAPTDPWEAAVLTRELSDLPGPKYLRLDKGKAGLPEDPKSVTFGKARKVREGTDLTLVATGAILSEALAAADALSAEGVETRVLGIHTLKPFDAEAIRQSAEETGGLVTVEEHNVLGGLAGVIAETCLEMGVSLGFFRRIGLRDEYPTVVGDQDYLRCAYGLDRVAIVAAAKDGLKEGNISS
tara:strand:- start:302 stop:1237 length:936 start_codon:yes stop_codon:yes gene_type:complete